MNEETTIVYNNDQIETVVGDEMQADFYPRVKLKKWDNEVNLSVGLVDDTGVHSVEGEKVSYETDKLIAEFYPVEPKAVPVYDTQARYINLGKLTPSRLSAVYELDEHLPSTRQTVFHYTTDQPTILYWGSYAREKFLDTSKIDIAEARLYDPRVGTNDPMFSDEGLHWIQINYTGEDVLTPMQAVIQTVLKSKGFETKIVGGKMYFKDGEKWVKFYSQATFENKSFFYINLNNDYNRAYTYHNTNTPEIRDLDAYGLGLDESVIDEIIAEYGKTFSLTTESFTQDELNELNRIEPYAGSREWIEESIRNDVTPFEVSDAFEFGITLKEVPTSNVVPLSVTTKGLDFFYQRPLTTEERFDGIRPPHVLGSYAAYHKTKTNNEYQAGKAFHIYRPWAEDATGKKVWCEFDADWDWENEQPLNITIPQDFLDTAVYPVFIDPTFGYLTAGGSNLIASSSLRTLDSESSIEEGIGESISVYRSVTNGGTADLVKWKTALYTSAGVLISSTTEQSSGIAVGASWNTVNTITAPSFSAGSKWISFWGTNAVYSTLQIFYDTVTSAGSNKNVSYVTGNSGWPDPLTGVTDDNNKYSIYVTYKDPTVYVTITDGTAQKQGVRIWP